VQKQTDDILTKARAERPCVVCGVLACFPLRHLDEVLTPENARRFAQVIMDDGADAPRTKMLARYILATTPDTIAPVFKHGMRVKYESTSQIARSRSASSRDVRAQDRRPRTCPGPTDGRVTKTCRNWSRRELLRRSTDLLT